ncbi:hypothetical protein PINS_up014325 [Pythium insidiosum]|nr:hypothetical protein PINS_up014325 [Pythium insidiosum]
MTEEMANATQLLAQQPLALGVSLPPNDVHSLSVSMPSWEDVVGYEEGRPHVLAALAAGYPRFFRHALVRRLEARLRETLPAFLALKAAAQGDRDDWDLMVLPTPATAQRLVDFLRRQPDVEEDVRSRVTAIEGPDGLVAVVAFPQALTKNGATVLAARGRDCVLTTRRARAAGARAGRRRGCSSTP